MATSVQIKSIHALYVGYFDRAADPAGISFWIKAIDAGATLDTITDAFANDKEAKDLYPYLAFPGLVSSKAFVGSIYSNLFNRPADEAGLKYWSDLLDAGKVTAGDMIQAITNGALTTDKTVLDNKIEAGTYFTLQAATTAGYKYSADDGKAAIDGVTEDPATVAASKTASDSSVARSAAAGKTFTLNASVDDITGTAGDDTFSGVVNSATPASNTVGAADVLDGGAGKDTLAITVATTAGAATIAGITTSNIETITVRNVDTGGFAATLNSSNFVGATEFVSDRSTSAVVLDNISNADVTVKGNGSTPNADTTINVGTTAVTDAFILNIKDGVKAGAINVNDAEADFTVATVNSTGAANTVGAVNLSGAGAGGGDHTIKTLNVNAATNLTTAQLTGFAVDSSVVISGAAAKVALGLGKAAAFVDSIDASGLTAGGLTVTLDNETDTKFVGGQGSDVVTAGTAAYIAANTASINAGAGTDTLVVGNAPALSTAASGAKFTGFESLEVKTNGTIDLDVIAGITSIVVDNAAGVDLNDVSTTQAGAITVQQSVTTNALDIAVKGAAIVGQIDTVKVTADDGVAATSTVVLGTPVLANVEKLELVAVDNLTVAALSGATGLTGVTASGAGTIGITTGAVAFAINTSLNASAATGAVTIDAGLANTNGLAITGSATAVNIITGSTASDVIVGGTGIDTISSSAGTDTINFASDSAKDVFNIDNLTGKSTITNFDAATATTTEDLVNVMNLEVDGSEVAITAAAGQVALTDDATIVVAQTAGAVGSLTTGGLQALVAADFTAATLTNVAAYFTEKFTTANNFDKALVFLNDGTNTYAYYINEGADGGNFDVGIQADEVSLVGIFNGAVLNAGDIYQTV
jgi:hypothetical protein